MLAHQVASLGMKRTGLQGQRRFPLLRRTRTKVFGVAILSLNDPCEPTAPNGLFNGLIWPKAGCASIAFAAMTPVKFLPLPAAPSFLARQETRRIAILR